VVWGRRRWGRGEEALWGHHVGHWRRRGEREARGRWWGWVGSGGNVEEWALLELQLIFYHIVDLEPKQVLVSVAFLDQVVHGRVASGAVVLLLLEVSFRQTVSSDPDDLDQGVVQVLIAVEQGGGAVAAGTTGSGRGNGGLLLLLFAV